jgi:hypothetical protein
MELTEETKTDHIECATPKIISDHFLITVIS